jgi:hypothetical protein
MRLNEFGSLCLAPVVLVGYLMSTDFHFRRSASTETGVDSAAMIEVQTCERGLGFEVKAATNGLYGAGFQYGFQYATGDYTVTLLPKAGLSYTDPTVRELPQDVQFGIGAQLLLGYKDVRVGAELWHLSNAGVTQPNIGLNLPVFQIGMVF